MDRMSFITRQWASIQDENISNVVITHSVLAFNYGTQMVKIKYENNTYALELFPSHEIEPLIVSI